MKRPSSSLSAASSPKRIRTKVEFNQGTLESFFSSSRAKSREHETRPAPSTFSSRNPNSKLESRPTKVEEKSHQEIIDVDLLESPPARTKLEPLLLPESTLKNSETVAKLGAKQEDLLLTEIPKYQPLDQDPLTFQLGVAPWTPGAPAPYSFLVHTLFTVSETRSRILILNALTNALRIIINYHPQSLLPSIYLLSNSLSPPYHPIELGIGTSVLSKAIQHVSGITPAALKRLIATTGDIGDAAFQAKSNLRTLIPIPPLTVRSVFESMLRIANAKGQGAAKQKHSLVEKMLVAAKGEEVRFLVRSLTLNLRVGAVRTSILTALARAACLTPPKLDLEPSVISQYTILDELLSKVQPLPTGKKKSEPDPTRQEVALKFAKAEALIRKVYVQHPNYDRISAALLRYGLDGLAENVPLTVGIPLHPALGSPTRSLDEIYERLGNSQFTAEFKYDGQRAQIHGSKSPNGKKQISIFSRHLEDMTSKYPDVVSLMETILDSSSDLTSFIIDSEIVAIDPRNNSLKSFQELSNRARKDVQLENVLIAVGVFAFDLMYLNGVALLEQAFRQRRNLLRSKLPPLTTHQQGTARFDHVESCESDAGRETIQEFWERAVESQCEGLMIKLLDASKISDCSDTSKKTSRKKPLLATYEPDKRTSAWLKLKKDYVDGLGDSLDLVPIGGWHGTGRKAQWWSPVLLALRDPESGQLVGVCKCMSGFSDAFYKSMKERYAEESESCSRENVWGCETGGLRPYVYFKPQEVWEIRGADVTISPVSVAAKGVVSESRGLSLRFPRFMKLREDKAIQQASTPEFLANMWRRQQGKQKSHGGADEGELVDFEEDAEEEEEDCLSDVDT